jgi:predicted nucleic acid-binding protein
MGASAFIDTNVLIYSMISESPLHQRARSVLRDLKENAWELWINEQVIREATCVLTKSSFLDPPLDVATVTMDLLKVAKQFHVAPMTSISRNLFLVNVQMYGLRGTKVFDAGIVASMSEFKVSTLITNNTADFLRMLPESSVVSLLDWPLGDRPTE